MRRCIFAGDAVSMVRHNQGGFVAARLDNIK